MKRIYKRSELKENDINANFTHLSETIDGIIRRIGNLEDSHRNQLSINANHAKAIEVLAEEIGMLVDREGAES